MSKKSLIPNIIFMKVQFTKSMVAALAIGALPLCGHAKTGAPHTVKADVLFDKVTLSWNAPVDAKELKWHDGDDYNGDVAESTNPQKSVKTWAAARFDASDLKATVGEKVVAIDVFQYRLVAGMTAYVYENGVVVGKGNGDMSKYEKNTFQHIVLSEPVEIKAGNEYMFAVCYEHGSNFDFVANKDRATDAPGKGDLFSSDGKNWVPTGAGDYMITAVLANDADEAPVGYNVYDGAVLLTPSPVTGTSLVLDGQADGTHSYTVEAVYAEGALKALPLDVFTRKFASTAPSPSFGASTVNDLSVGLKWTAPLMGGPSLTWSATDQVGVSIGGTASSKTKVWIRNQFEPNDLVAFAGGKITAVNYVFKESVMSQVTAWVMEDGQLIQAVDMDAESVAAIQPGQRIKITLAQPVEIKQGHSYAYGLYVMHTPKAHPMSVDASEGVNVKGNSFSTSSPDSKDFLKSKPSWKTLASGGIAGNWLMTADIEGAAAISDAVTYELSRNGEPLATGLTALSYDDTVDAPGVYSYTLVSKTGSRTGEGVSTDVTVALPAAYAAPLIEDAAFDENTGDISIAWNTDKELSHYGDATYQVGFDEEMTMMWGSQFTADELGAYKGLSIERLKFIVGSAVAGLKVGVYTKSGKPLSEVDLSGETVQPLALYELKLPTPVEISGAEDLVLAYSGTLAAGTSPIILDAGPLVQGGARVSLTGGASWMNLGTINSTYNNYNIAISAIAVDKPEAKTRGVEMRGQTLNTLPARVAMVENREFGVEIPASEIVAAPVRKASERPRVASFNVYCNGEKTASTSETSYAGKVSGYGKFTYHVTAVYTNGWESPASQKLTYSRSIAQKARAPYGLNGTLKADGAAELTWQAPGEATVLTYNTTPITYGFGLTGSNIETYAAQKFPADQLAAHVGKKISHITFGLLDNNLKSAEVIVVVDENIMYSQSVDVKTIVKGVNDVRLNEPYEIVAGRNIGVGYHIVYNSGVKPIACDAGPAVPNWGDLFSKSGSPGYWYSNLVKNKFDWNIYASAILSAADTEVVVKDAPKTASRAGETSPELTYNVYCDGTLVAEGLKTTTYTTGANAYGTYHVTAVDESGESGESNLFTLKGESGVGDIFEDNGSDSNARYYNLQGFEIERATAAPGIYIRKSGAGVAKVIIR